MSRIPALTATRTEPEMIRPMREDHRREMGRRIGHDSRHARGFVTPYLLREHDEIVGYSTAGGAPGDARTAVKELYLVPWRRGHALPLLDAVTAVSGVTPSSSPTG